MTTFSAASSVAERLEILLLAEGAPAKAAGDLHNDVKSLQSELMGIAGRAGENAQKIKQLAYDIEDAVESYVRREGAVSSEGTSVVRVFRHHSRGKSLRLELRCFHERIEELGKKSSDGVVVEPEQRQSRRPQLVPVDNCKLVGMDMEAERLKSFLLGKELNLSVIAISGVGGAGKTTLAEHVYDDVSVRNHFCSRAWATVTRAFQARDILENLLLCLDAKEVAEMGTMELIEQLHKAQTGRRYLVVLDDFWSEEAWKTLKYAFPNDNKGSRIVITTRKTEVEGSFGDRMDVLEKQLLNEDQGWEILKERTGLKDGDMEANPWIEKIGKQIVSLCGGLPLSVGVIGGILSGKDLKDWAGMIKALQSETSEGFPHSLELSYNDLPSYLKPCFLYLGHFPPGEAISAEQLYLLWMAEGLISLKDRSDNTTRMEAAEDYFEELVSRNLVIAVEKEEVSASKRFKSFKVHDLIRAFCISKAKLEGFSEIIGCGYKDKISSFTRRLVMYLNECNEDTCDVLSNLTEAIHIRSILFFHMNESVPEAAWPIEFSDLKKFQKMKILNFEGINFRVKELPRGIEKLLYLRHLGFRGCYLEEFSSSFCNFSFLETLDLRVRVSCIITIPNVLNKLSSLRHLYFPLAFRSNTKAKLKLDKLEKLEILENFRADICEVLDLLQLKNLQILIGMVNGNTMDLKNIVECINGKKLRHSSLMVKNFDTYSKEGISVVAKLLESDGVHAFHIEGHLDEFRFPEGLGSNFREIVFDGSKFQKDPMATLGKLPHLNKLVLCNDAFVGQEMVCSESEFPQLKSLTLSTLRYLKNWRFNGDLHIMPSLTVLTIERCGKLGRLPRELYRTLKNITIGSMPIKFVEEVKKLVEELRDRGNELVAFYDC